MTYHDLIQEQKWYRLMPRRGSHEPSVCDVCGYIALDRYWDQHEAVQILPEEKIVLMLAGRKPGTYRPEVARRRGYSG